MIELWASTPLIIRLPAVVQVVGEVMAIDVMNQEFSLKAGDNQTIRFTVQEDQSVTDEGPPPKHPIDALLDKFKFSIKRQADMLHEMFFRTSFRAGDIDLSGAADSHVALSVLAEDLRGAMQGTYRWELETFRVGTFQAGTGTVSVDAGAVDVYGVGTAFSTELKSGDVLDLGGDLTVVRRIYDDEHISVDPGDWTTLSGIGFQFADRQSNWTISAGWVIIHNELTV